MEEKTIKIRWMIQKKLHNKKFGPFEPNCHKIASFKIFRVYLLEPAISHKDRKSRYYLMEIFS